MLKKLHSLIRMLAYICRGTPESPLCIQQQGLRCMISYHLSTLGSGRIFTEVIMRMFTFCAPLSKRVQEGAFPKVNRKNAMILSRASMTLMASAIE